MNPNRLRPVDVPKERLSAWLSDVIHDACRDATDAGMTDEDVHRLLGIVMKMYAPWWEKKR